MCPVSANPSWVVGRSFEVFVYAPRRDCWRLRLCRRFTWRYRRPDPPQIIGRLVILPCLICGTPMFPYVVHLCIGLADHLMELELAEMLGEDADDE